MTLENFDTDGGRNTTREGKESLVSAKQAAETFATDPDGWLFFSGPPGSGKTHLAVGIAGESLRRGQPVFYAFIPSLLDHLRATFSPDSPIGYDELFEQIKTVPLLILDDLGAESSTAWADEKLYQIVVHRHELRLPTVITSTSSLDELEDTKPRIASRLTDSRVVDWRPIAATNYRDQSRNRETRPATNRPAPRRNRSG
jgi:DNA replication protein DnaC